MSTKTASAPGFAAPDQAGAASEQRHASDLAGAMRATPTSVGQTLYELTREAPTLLVFLRQLGCTFCRQALSDISKQRAEINETGTRVVLVHMASFEVAEAYFADYGLQDVAHISDAEQTLYQAFGLGRGRFSQLFGFKVIMRGLRSGIIEKNGQGPRLGDPFQMPGVFLLRDGEVLNDFRHQYASDRPNYLSLCALDVPRPRS